MAAPLRVGLLSTANINRKLLGGARAAEGVAVVAVASRDGARAEAYAAEHGIARAHASYEAMLADPDVDAVYVPLPNSMHVEWSIKALEAGKHVLSEKPMARSPQEVERAFDVAERVDRVLMEAFMWRFHVQTEELVRAAATIGDLRVIRAAFGFSLPWMENVRWDPALEGGALMDVGCYCVSAMRLLAGEPVRVSGDQVLNNGVDARFTGMLRFAGDVLGIFDCGMDVHRRNQLEIVGSEGTIYVPFPWQTPLGAGFSITRDGEPEQITPETVDPYGRELDEMGR